VRPWTVLFFLRLQFSTGFS